METLGSLRRTNYCGEVTLAMAGQEMTVCGSIARARDKGGIIFADLRDTTGILQLVFDEDTPKDVFAKAESLKSEYVVICRGKLRERAAKTDKIATGDVELYVSELRILSEAQTTPFELRDEINVNDDLRLRYRYLDLRRPSMHEPIVLRSKIMQIIRNYFCENHFTEIETPTLIKSTPEGARDYLVPSRVQPGHFYALPQSPQLYKQILMLSGFDRYFQLALLPRRGSARRPPARVHPGGRGDELCLRGRHHDPERGPHQAPVEGNAERRRRDPVLPHAVGRGHGPFRLRQARHPLWP